MATGRISNETRRTILELSAAGHSAGDIAESVGRNESSVARIIEGSEGSSKKSKKKKAAAEPAVPARKRPSSSGLTHHFWLRPGLEISLELPSDLTGDEAQRLAAVIQSLPFHN